MNKKLVIFIFLFLIFCLSFFIRTYFSYNIIFSDGAVKYGDDAMYHMRFLENLLLGGHFPSFIYFDAFTNFPHGTYDGIAPLYDFILACVIWLISLGKPTLEVINKIAPFYPVFLGSLIPIAVYFITRVFWDAKVSFVAAVLSSISTPILYKSLLGYNDHHVAEILFSSLTMIFLLYGLREAKNSVSAKNINLWVYIFLCGISMGAYLLIWRGAIIFLFLIFIFFILFYVMEFIRQKPADWILFAGAIVFLVSFLMIVPFFGHPNLSIGIYNIYHLIVYGLGFFTFFMLWIFSAVIKNKFLNRWLIIVFFTGALVIIALFLKFIFPDVFKDIFVLAGALNNNGLFGASFKNIVSEMQSLTYQGAIQDFYSLFFMFLLGFFIIFYRYIKEKKPEYLLLIIWAIVSFFITGIIPSFGQERFDIYLSIPVIIFSSFIIVKGFQFGWKSLHISSSLEKDNPFRMYFLVGSIAIIVGLVFFIIYPFPFNAGLQSPQSLPALAQAAFMAVQNPIRVDNDLYLLLKWLKENTPDPGVDYYALYKEPKANKDVVEDFVYPENSYGVLSHWERGHAIEYYGHRMPVANPFQQGIGRKENGQVKEIGEGVFFLETDESKAVKYLDDLRVKYIITDNKFALPGYFDTMIKAVQGDLIGYTEEPNGVLTKKDNAMISRLHLLDGSQTDIEIKLKEKPVDLTVSSLSHFRLLYESSTTVNNLRYKNINKEIKAFKVFEYVKGAEIKGKTYPGANINISTEITTNQGRNFEYKNETTADSNGKFSFIVPYSTGKQEKSDVTASEYTLKIGNWIRKIKVSEDDILQGKTISI
jgi:dolichyl-diphosphooligosaccharide--protein glycosyltransferase